MSGDRYRIADQNATYFLTLTVVDWIDLFTRKEYCLAIVDSLNYCIKEKNIEVFAWVIMSSHVHLVARVKEPDNLSGVLRDFKKFTSKSIIQIMNEIGESRREWLLARFSDEANKTGRAKNYKIWRDDNHAIELGGYIDVETRVNYVHQNPVKAMMVHQAEQFIFSSAADYAGGKGLVTISYF